MDERTTIYLDDAINAVERVLGDCEITRTVQTALYILPPAQPPWIPCSERLPEESGQYYVSGGNKVWICKFLILPNFIGGWCDDVSNPEVQAWIPHPEPYQEDNE